MLSSYQLAADSLSSRIEPLLTRLTTTRKLGISYGTIEIDSLTSFNSCSSNDGATRAADRFRLSVPYCKQNLTWNVFFDSQCPDMGPDFIFNDNNFLTDMDVNTLSVRIPSLATWNPNDKDALLNVLMELLSCYKQYQIQLMDRQARLSAEYNMLMDSTDVKSEDVEMILLPFGFKPTEAKFLISLSVNVSQLPQIMYNSFATVPELETAMLLVTFSGADWSRIVPQLTLSEALEEILVQRGAGPLNIPPFPPDQYLLNYVQEIKKYISSKVNLVAQRYEKRVAYISAFTSHRRRSIIEVDSTNYEYAACMISQKDFNCMVLVTLPLDFPATEPLVALRSVYHMTSPTDPYYEILDKYPYDMHWPPTRMIKQLFDFLRGAIDRFKRNSVGTYLVRE